MKRLWMTLLCLFLLVGAAQADNIYWTDWTSVTPGAPGSASGTIAFPSGNVTVSYIGDAFTPSEYGAWSPASAFTGGIVGNAPPGSNEIALTGGSSAGNPYTFEYSLTFSQPVVNPVIAVLSLGGIPTYARMQFTSPFTVVATGGPSTSFGENGPLYATTPNYTLYGGEPYSPPAGGGNGTIEFTGTYSTITWYSLDYEHWYMITVGAPSAVPLPPTILLLGSGLMGLGLLRFRRKA